MEKVETVWMRPPDGGPAVAVAVPELVPYMVQGYTQAPEPHEESR